MQREEARFGQTIIDDTIGFHCGHDRLDSFQFPSLQWCREAQSLKVVELVVGEQGVAVGVAEGEDAREGRDTGRFESL